MWYSRHQKLQTLHICAKGCLTTMYISCDDCCWWQCLCHEMKYCLMSVRVMTWSVVDDSVCVMRWSVVWWVSVSWRVVDDSVYVMTLKRCLTTMTKERKLFVSLSFFTSSSRSVISGTQSNTAQQQKYSVLLQFTIWMAL